LKGCIGLKLRLRRFSYWTHSGHQHYNRISANEVVAAGFQSRASFCASVS
jgi:hypothetical protein